MLPPAKRALFTKISRRALQLTLCSTLLIPALSPSMAQPTANTEAANSVNYALRINYLDSAAEGLYEVQVNQAHQLVMTAVIDREKTKDDLGYLYAFDSNTLEPRWRLDMPHQAFSLAQDPNDNKLFVGHGKNNALRLSRVDIATGKLEKTGERLKVRPDSENFEGNQNLRHMVYVPEVNALFVGYSSTSSEATGSKKSQKLLVVDPDSLAVITEVEGAYPSTGYALNYDAEQKKLYTAGTFINVIDPAKRAVVRSIDLEQLDPAPRNILALTVDAKNNRIFAAHNVFRSEGEDDGVYVLDLKTGKQLDFVRSGRGSISIVYNPSLNEAYVANFRAGNVSIINGEDYSVERTFNVGPLPNEMAFDAENNRLYVGVKEVYSPRSSTGDFVAGAKEKILKIDLPEQH